MIGVSIPTITNYENGITSPKNIEIFLKLADALKVDQNYLVGNRAPLADENYTYFKELGFSEKSYDTLLLLKYTRELNIIPYDVSKILSIIFDDFDFAHALFSDLNNFFNCITHISLDNIIHDSGYMTATYVDYGEVYLNSIATAIRERFYSLDKKNHNFYARYKEFSKYYYSLMKNVLYFQIFPMYLEEINEIARKSSANEAITQEESEKLNVAIDFLQVLNKLPKKFSDIFPIEIYNFFTQKQKPKK